MGAVLGESPATRTVLLPHHVVPAPRTERAEARRALGLPPDRPVAVTLGVVTPAKRVGRILEALAALPPARRPFLFVGGAVADDDPLHLFVETNGLARDVAFGGYLSESDFWRAASAADFGVNLRHPTMGETSGAVCRLAGSGLPLIVSDTGWFRELPDAFAAKVPVGGDEVARLAEEMTRLAFEPDVARLRARAASEWGDERHPDRVALGVSRRAGERRAGEEARQRGPARPSVRRSRRLSVGFIGPFPPVRSGIADYDAELFPALAALAEARAWQPETGARGPGGEPRRAALRDRERSPPRAFRRSALRSRPAHAGRRGPPRVRAPPPLRGGLPHARPRGRLRAGARARARRAREGVRGVPAARPARPRLGPRPVGVPDVRRSDSCGGGGHRPLRARDRRDPGRVSGHARRDDSAARRAHPAHVARGGARGTRPSAGPARRHHARHRGAGEAHRENPRGARGAPARTGGRFSSWAGPSPRTIPSESFVRENGPRGGREIRRLSVRGGSLPRGVGGDVRRQSPVPDAGRNVACRLPARGLRASAHRLGHRLVPRAAGRVHGQDPDRGRRGGSPRARDGTPVVRGEPRARPRGRRRPPGPCPSGPSASRRPRATFWRRPRRAGRGRAAFPGGSRKRSRASASRRPGSHGAASRVPDGLLVAEVASRAAGILPRVLEKEGSCSEKRRLRS